MGRHSDYGFIFWVHIAVIVAIFASPLLLRWQYISFFVVLYYIQILLLGGCILTKRQFKNADLHFTFYHYYLTKLGLKLNRRVVNNVVDYVLPWVVLATAYVWQAVLGKGPLI